VISSYGFHRTTIYKWLAIAFSAGKGVKALRSRPATGRPRSLTRHQEKQVFAWVNGKDPRQYGLDFGLWTRAMIASLIEQKLAVKLGLTAVGELLAKLGLTPQKPLERAYQRNPVAIEKWKRESFPSIAGAAKAVGGEAYFWDESGFRADTVHGKTWDIAPLASEPSRPAQPSASVRQAEDESTLPKAEAPLEYRTHLFDLIGAYHAPHVPNFSMASPFQLEGLVRDGKLYLSLHDAIVLAIENNLDVEVSGYNLLLAETDVKRAKGGANLRGLDYTVMQMAPGVGSQTSPLLITATTTGTVSPTSVNVTDLSQVTQIGNSVEENLSENGTSTYSPGPNIPLIDPVVTAESSYFRRSDEVSLETTGAGGASSAGTGSAGPLDFVSAGLDYQQGFSTGAQLDAFTDNASQVLYGANTQCNPAHAASTSLTLTQPLPRRRGREVNLRFVHIAQLGRKASRLVFEQQLLETVYGVSRLYYDLVSLGENVGVKQESLDAAQKLYDDDKNQVDQGTLAPIELMRAQALLSSSRLDLIQSEGEYRQQEVILREQLVRNLVGPGTDFVFMVPIDRIVVPDAQPEFDVTALITDALGNRPDLAQAAVEVQADEIAAKAARNNVKPELNIYGNMQTRGSSLVPYTLPGSDGTGIATVPLALFEGGLKLSTYQGGVQLLTKR
jgi:transposase